jgi:hypothetical protein
MKKPFHLFPNCKKRYKTKKLEYADMWREEEKDGKKKKG